MSDYIGVDMFEQVVNKGDRLLYMSTMGYGGHKPKLCVGYADSRTPNGGWRCTPTWNEYGEIEIKPRYIGDTEVFRLPDDLSVPNDRRQPQ